MVAVTVAPDGLDALAAGCIAPCRATRRGGSTAVDRTAQARPQSGGARCASRLAKAATEADYMRRAVRAHRRHAAGTRDRRQGSRARDADHAERRAAARFQRRGVRARPQPCRSADCASRASRVCRRFRCRWRLSHGCPLGLSLLGPPGRDRALIALAARFSLRSGLDAAPRRRARASFPPHSFGGLRQGNLLDPL